MTRAAIQGIQGSFHHAAARLYLGPEIEVLPCHTFAELIDSVETAHADFGIMAVENTIAGSLLPNYRLIVNTPLFIVGEIYLRIKQNLLALPGQRLADIHSVHSHPIALEQCREYLARHPEMRLLEAEDTALSARAIAQDQILGRAAIAGHEAAELYGLEILATGIETHPSNYTRFWVLNRNAKPGRGKINKASLSFSLQHSPGMLAKLLTVLADHNINLSKIQSLPIIGKAWEYHFFVDLVFIDRTHYETALATIKPMTESLRVLGEYLQGEKNILALE